MAMIFIDSVDHYATAQLLSKWSASFSTVAVGATGRSGSGNKLSLTGSVVYDFPAAVTNSYAVVIGTGFYSSTPEGYIVLTGNDYLLRVGISVNANGSISAYRASATPAFSVRAYTNGIKTYGTLLGTSAVGLITANTWYYIEMKAVQHDSAGYVIVYVNGVEVTFTPSCSSGIDTYPNGSGATTDTTGLSLGYGMATDDVYILDTSGSVNNDLLGETRTDCHFPVTPNGTDSEWTRSTGADDWAVVDEAAVNTTDYIESTAVGDQTSFNVTPLIVVGGTMYGVQATAYLTKMNAGPGKVKPYVLRGGTRYYGPEWAPSFGSWDFFRYVWDQDPAAGPGTWTETNFNNSEFGLERTT